MKQFRFLPDGAPSGEPMVGEDVADRGLALCMLGALEGFLREASHRHGWDQPPSLGFMSMLGRTPVAPGRLVEGMALEWRPVPNAAAAFRAYERLHEVPVILGSAVRDKVIDLPLPPSIIAAVLVSEAWAVSTKGEDYRKISDAVENRTLHRHPERVEVKTASAVDVHGVMYMVMRPRDPEYPTVAMANVPNGSGIQPGGDIPVSLLYMMKAMQGATLPDYETFSKDYPVTYQG